VNPDFYVGYLPKAPSRLGAFLRRTSLALVLMGVLIAGVLAWGQLPFAGSLFEFQQYRPYRGRLQAQPYPALITREARYLLVGPGKHGWLPSVAVSGRTVILQGALARRGDVRLLEVMPDSLQVVAGSETPEQFVDLGEVHLRGEIVDSKCYLGVMNPGSGKVHRDCATRCISGGIPPAFVVKDGAGNSRVLLLAGSDGRPLGREVLGVVGEPLTISGHLQRSGSQLILLAGPGNNWWR
jgi:hypothetical protein